MTKVNTSKKPTRKQERADLQDEFVRLSVDFASSIADRLSDLRAEAKVYYTAVRALRYSDGKSFDDLVKRSNEQHPGLRAALSLNVHHSLPESPRLPVEACLYALLEQHELTDQVVIYRSTVGTYYVEELWNHVVYGPLPDVASAMSVLTNDIVRPHLEQMAEDAAAEAAHAAETAEYGDPDAADSRWDDLCKIVAADVAADGALQQQPSDGVLDGLEALGEQQAALAAVFQAHEASFTDRKST